MELVTLEGKLYQTGFKVVHEDMTSLGLRKNPNIMTFPFNEWVVLPETDLVEGRADWGGIWLARNRSGARKYINYMMSHYQKRTRVFHTAIDRILFMNPGRIKTNAVYLLEEIEL
ncbi:MAG: hypothetical protein KC535_00700 [Nanoarchaeota archaeon]|nr:hypothetical protein [Nanoarchaeota archaeon]